MLDPWGCWFVRWWFSIIDKKVSQIGWWYKSIIWHPMVRELFSHTMVSPSKKMVGRISVGLCTPRIFVTQATTPRPNWKNKARVLYFNTGPHKHPELCCMLWQKKEEGLWSFDRSLLLLSKLTRALNFVFVQKKFRYPATLNYPLVAVTRINLLILYSDKKITSPSLLIISISSPFFIPFLSTGENNKSDYFFSPFSSQFHKHRKKVIVAYFHQI